MANKQNMSSDWGDRDDDEEVTLLHSTQYCCLPTDTTGSLDAPITGQDCQEKRTEDILKKTEGEISQTPN